MKERQALASLCRKVGARTPEWVQGNGANLSVKTGSKLLIKVSGSRLENVTESDLIEIDASPFKKLARVTLTPEAGEAEYSQALKEGKQKSSLRRPSMESGAHAVLPGKWVIHLHSLAAILMASEAARDAKQLRQLSEKVGAKVGLIPFCKPGWELCQKTESLVDCSILLLQNHGVILQGNEAPDSNSGILTRWARWEEKWCEANRCSLLSELLKSSAKREETFSRLGPTPKKIYFPDIAVFEPEIDAMLEANAAPSSSDKGLAEMWLATRILFHEKTALEELPASHRKEIPEMDSEKHRRKVAL